MIDDTELLSTSGVAPAQGASAEVGRKEFAPAPARPERVRVVLSEVTGGRPTPVVKAELDAQTEVGEVLVRGLVRAQFGLAMRMAALVAGSLGSLPLLFAVVPGLAAVRLLGIRLPWLLLGVAAYPLFVGVGWLYTRGAERNERDFVELVERS